MSADVNVETFTRKNFEKRDVFCVLCIMKNR